MSGTQLSELRHNLRTPLKLILSYAEMLIEDASASGVTLGLTALRNIHSSARAALADVNEALANRDSVESGETRALFGKLRPRAERIQALFGELAGEPQWWGAPDWPQDLARIRFAAESLSHLLSIADPSQPLPMEDLAPAEPHGAVPTGLRVLVSIDNATDRMLLCRRLEREGYVAEEAETGNSTLDRLTLEEFDLILLDLTWPLMDGLGILARMRENPKLRPVPVIVIAAIDWIESVARAIQMGAEDYLLKPFHPVLLRTRVGAVLERHRLRKELGDRSHERSSGA